MSSKQKNQSIVMTSQAQSNSGISSSPPKQVISESNPPSSDSLFTFVPPAAPADETGLCRVIQSSLVRIPTPDYDTKPPSAVIVTIRGGYSYDSLYQSVEQVSPNPDFSIALFQASYSDLNAIRSGARIIGESEAVISDLIRCIEAVDPGSVVFNFECCSVCSETGFHETLATNVMNFLEWALSRQFVMSFADFSLKSLIHEWDERILGPNPLLNVGTCNDHMTLKFDPEVLIACPNAQLQNVGRMCETGSSVLHAMGGTIVFDINHSKTDTDVYKLTVLSIALADSNRNPQSHCGIHRGTAGHVMLKFESGGILFLSAGHWIELSRLDTTEASVLRAAEASLGATYAADLQQQLERCTSVTERDQCVQMGARLVIQSSAPCSYSSR